MPGKERLRGVSTSFDLVVRCPQLSSGSLATELLLRAASLPDHTVQRSGDDFDSATRFMVARFAGRVTFVAEFFLDADELIAAYVSSPAEWSASKRATACAFDTAVTPATRRCARALRATASRCESVTASRR